MSTTVTGEATRDGVTRVLALVVEVLLGVYVVLYVVDKQAHDLANALAATAAVAALLLERKSPSKGTARKVRLLLAGASGMFVLVNLLSFTLADAEAAGGVKCDYELLHLDGAVVVLAAGLGLRNSRAAWRLLTVLLVAAGAWYAFDAATAWPRSAGLMLGRKSWLVRKLELCGRGPFRDGRFCGFRRWHTVLAMELLPLLALFLGCAAALRRRWPALACLAGALLTAVLLVMTQTRFALLTGAFVTVPAVLVTQRRFLSPRGRLVAAGLWLGAVVPVLAAAWWWTASPERRDPAHAVSRVRAWRVALRIEANSPWAARLVGNGPVRHAFPEAARRRGAEDPDVLREGLPHAHSVPMQALVETGLLGVAALGGIFGAGLIGACFA